MATPIQRILSFAKMSSAGRNRRHYSRLNVATLFVAMLCCVPTLFAADSRSPLGSEDDGPEGIDRHFGPYDYYKAPTGRPGVPGAVAVVEKYHMGFILADLLRLKDYCGYYGSLRYTLRAIPNHPIALKLMSEYFDSHPPCYAPGGASQDSDREYTNRSGSLAAEIMEGDWRKQDTDFYFQTALNFMTEDTRTIPKHAETHVLYADWLRKKGRLDEAMKQYESARSLKPGYANTYYGLGMLFLDQKNVTRAVENAKKAYSLGKPPPDLQERLTAAGAWPASATPKTTSP